jgi:hypothetical protein
MVHVLGASLSMTDPSRSRQHRHAVSWTEGIMSTRHAQPSPLMVFVGLKKPQVKRSASVGGENKDC